MAGNKYPEQIPLDFEGKFDLEKIIEKLKADERLLESYVSRALENLKATSGSRLTPSVSKEALRIYWQDNGGVTSELGEKKLERFASAMFPLILKISARLFREEKEQEPSQIKKPLVNERSRFAPKRKNGAREVNAGEPYNDYMLDASGEHRSKEDD